MHNFTCLYNHTYLCTQVMDIHSNAHMVTILPYSAFCGSCASHQFIPCLLSSLGSCAHGGLQKVSRPLVVQLNWRGFAYKAGAWGRDSAPNSSSPLYWVAPLLDGRWVQDDYSSATKFMPNVPYPTPAGFFVAPSQLLPFQVCPWAWQLPPSASLMGYGWPRLPYAFFTNSLSEILNPIVIQGWFYS